MQDIGTFYSESVVNEMMQDAVNKAVRAERRKLHKKRQNLKIQRIIGLLLILLAIILFQRFPQITLLLLVLGAFLLPDWD